MGEDERKAYVAIKAILDLAASNFPDETNITISTEGKNHGAVVLPYYSLSVLLKEPE